MAAPQSWIAQSIGYRTLAGNPQAGSLAAPGNFVMAR